jgi:predicted kinase
MESTAAPSTDLNPQSPAGSPTQAASAPRPHRSAPAALKPGPRLVMMKGLPGSGKTSWANQYILDHPTGAVVRVGKDFLREMLNAGRSHTSPAEKPVSTAEDALITLFLTQQKTVIVDDLNLAPRHEIRLRQLATAAHAEFEVQDFTGVAVGTCIQRDLGRPRSVGEKVIRDLYRTCLEPARQVYVPPAGKPSAVIVDIDGTVALMASRTPFKWHKVGTDRPNTPVIGLVRDLAAAGETIIFCSGRDTVCRAETETWLAEHVRVPYAQLLMRAAGDNRKDTVVKAEIFDRHLRDQYAIRLVLDDRDVVVRTWRNLGLTVLQVADGDF